MIESIFGSFYYRLIIAVVLAVILAFIHKIDIFQNKLILLSSIFILILLTFTNVHDDFGLVILFIAIVVLSYKAINLNHINAIYVN